jgi:hypothetical protein
MTHTTANLTLVCMDAVQVGSDLLCEMSDGTLAQFRLHFPLIQCSHWDRRNLKPEQFRFLTADQIRARCQELNCIEKAYQMGQPTSLTHYRSQRDRYLANR